MIPSSTRASAPNCCGAILSGGLSRRMAGRNKAFLDVGGRTILDRLLDCLQTFFEEIVIVTRQPRHYRDFPVKVVGDLYRDRSSLTGIHAALVNAHAAFGFVVPCDTPFLQPKVVQLLLDALEPHVDVLVPLIGNHYEPLCAIYSKRCVPIIAKQLDCGDYKIFNFFDRVNVKVVTAEQIRTVDPELLSFFNVNTPEAHRASQAMARNV